MNFSLGLVSGEWFRQIKCYLPEQFWQITPSLCININGIHKYHLSTKDILIPSRHPVVPLVYHDNIATLGLVDISIQ